MGLFVKMLGCYPLSSSECPGQEDTDARGCRSHCSVREVTLGQSQNAKRVHTELHREVGAGDSGQADPESTLPPDFQ